MLFYFSILLFIVFDTNKFVRKRFGIKSKKKYKKYNLGRMTNRVLNYMIYWLTILFGIDYLLINTNDTISRILFSIVVSILGLLFLYVILTNKDKLKRK